METYTIVLVVYILGVEYVGKKNADHLATILKKYHNITEDWEGKKYATQQLVKPTNTSPLLNGKGIKRIQGIVGALIYVGRAVNNKLLVALSTIGAQQEAATEDIVAAIGKLLDYVATYPNDGILLRKSDMILTEQADVGSLNKSRAISRAGAHIFLSENEPKPKLNGTVLTISQIARTVMSSTAEA